MRKAPETRSFGCVKITPLYLAALAVDAIEGLDAVGTRPPFVESDDFVLGCVLDTRGRRWIVKCPKTASAATALEAEVTLSPYLLGQLREGKLPFDIVRPAGFAQVEGNGRAVVYPEPFGSPIDFEVMDDAGARELGRTLASIHLLPPSMIDDAGLPAYTAEQLRLRLVAELKDADEASPIPSVLKRRWDTVLGNSLLWDFTPRVVHGDVASENFLWSNGSVTTVVGFNESHVGDPASDLAPLLTFGEEFFAGVQESYEHTVGASLDDAVGERAQFHSEYALVRWLMFGKRTSNTQIVSEARDMLNNLATQIDSTEA